MMFDPNFLCNLAAGRYSSSNRSSSDSQTATLPCHTLPPLKAAATITNTTLNVESRDGTGEKTTRTSRRWEGKEGDLVRAGAWGQGLETHMCLELQVCFFFLSLFFFLLMICLQLDYADDSDNHHQQLPHPSLYHHTCTTTVRPQLPPLWWGMPASWTGYNINERAQMTKSLVAWALGIQTVFFF
jgi:hypothetical protein